MMKRGSFTLLARALCLRVNGKRRSMMLKQDDSVLFKTGMLLSLERYLFFEQILGVTISYITICDPRKV